MMAYGCSADSIDEYKRMSKSFLCILSRTKLRFSFIYFLGESTTLECLKQFCNAIITLYHPTYLQTPNEEDTKRLLEVGKERGFPGMLGSLNCMHWT
jgi:hypothetical protein